MCEAGMAHEFLRPPTLLSSRRQRTAPEPTAPAEAPEQGSHWWKGLCETGGQKIAIVRMRGP